MNTRAFTLALVIAMVAMFMVHTYIEDQQSALIKKYGTMSSVLVAKEDIREFDLLDETKVSIVTVPQKFLAPGSFKTVKEIENTIATVPILKGEQITKPRVTYPGESTGLSREVTVGMRAIAFQVDERSSVGKLIRPGDRVDVLAPMDYTGGARMDRQKIVTILQDVRVLSTGKSVSNNIPLIGVKTADVVRKMKLNTYSNYTTVTLELSPFQAQKLTHLYLFQSNKPILTLRNINDGEKQLIEGTRLYDILSDADRNEARAYFNEKYKKKN
ncbi:MULTISPECIES: Flp pilus assembly protein CpaB [Halobacteriovorax]|uniref:Flp pilus assembly protein CpaB n=1 Tax=Halobacteriovorax vibrionivorans TaxID=2152716 RepID=A0ABY0IJV0_9BACT|nr:MULTISPECIES: Flp pilus assembly protein CpaB [Halobacteriovorax]AYF43215.1 putative Flp pilus assembly protein CpaB [Halobacteriovorax sp. BALOs_7]RZF23231.1 Flp pilus assembly protein CpaB [Halobacteriovorax vibrionivorans]TGD46384.1 Flp pilus assembly protein CpaB [Halobacteriovorax sp. Y22]